MSQTATGLYEIFLKLVKETPNEVAIQFGGELFTYQDLQNRILSIETSIVERVMQRNFSPGDQVYICYWGDNHPIALVLPLVCSKLGLTYVPISPLYPKERVSEVVASLNVVLLSQTDFEIRKPKGNPIPSHDRQKYLLGFYTSGTTGLPKLALIPEEQVMTNTEASIRVQSLGRGDQILAGLSLCHSGGLGIQALPGLLSGARINLKTNLTPEALANASDSSNVVLLVPSLLQKLKLSRHGQNIRWQRFRLVGIGSASFTASLVEPILDAGSQVLNIYGLTEAGPVLFTEILTKGEAPSIGRPTTKTEWKIDENTSELLVRGKIAQAVYQSDHVIDHVHDNEGWFNTRDRVESRDNKLYFLGRTNATFNIGGMKVHAEKIEAAIENLPGVTGCLLIGRKHAVFGEILVAQVELSDLGISKRQLIRLLRGRHPEFSRYEIPREIEFVERLARTTIGKKMRGTRA